jgi:hypothetical protein
MSAWWNGKIEAAYHNNVTIVGLGDGPVQVPYWGSRPELIELSTLRTKAFSISRSRRSASTTARRPTVDSSRTP